MRTVINVEDITPEVTGATSKDYLAGYLRAKEKLAMQIKAFSACGLAEAEQRAKAQMRFVDGKICEYRAKIKEEEREMYRMVLKVMMACDYAKIGSSGDYAKIGSSGDYAQINSSGEDSVIMCAGHGSVVKAKVGSWITLAEWKYNKDKGHCVPKCVKTEFVDGERIKGDTWYRLVDGEFKEVDEP